MLHKNVLLKSQVTWLVESVFKFSPSNQAYLSNYSYIGICCYPSKFSDWIIIPNGSKHVRTEKDFIFGLFWVENK